MGIRGVMPNSNNIHPDTDKRTLTYVLTRSPVRALERVKHALAVDPQVSIIDVDVSNFTLFLNPR